MSPPTFPQPNPRADTRSPVPPSARYSMRSSLAERARLGLEQAPRARPEDLPPARVERAEPASEARRVHLIEDHSTAGQPLGEVPVDHVSVAPLPAQMVTSPLAFRADRRGAPSGCQGALRPASARRRAAASTRPPGSRSTIPMNSAPKIKRWKST